MPVSFCFNCYRLHNILKSGHVKPPSLFFAVKIVLALWGPLWFHMYFKNFLFHLFLNGFGVLLGVAVNLYITLGNMEMSTMLSSSV